jgi:hypothetical protein
LGELFGRTFGVQSLRGVAVSCVSSLECRGPVPEVLLSRLP